MAFSFSQFKNNNQNQSTMKKLLLLLTAIVVITLPSCTQTPAGTIENVDQVPDSIEVTRYYFAPDQFIYIARFKKSDPVASVSWEQQVGSGKHKHFVMRSCVFLNDTASVTPIRAWKLTPMKAWKKTID
jgi:hypothetical protein